MKAIITLPECPDNPASALRAVADLMDKGVVKLVEGEGAAISIEGAQQVYVKAVSDDEPNPQKRIDDAAAKVNEIMTGIMGNLLAPPKPGDIMNGFAEVLNMLGKLEA